MCTITHFILNVVIVIKKAKGVMVSCSGHGNRFMFFVLFHEYSWVFAKNAGNFTAFCLFVCSFSLFSRFPTDRKRCAHSMLTENQESFFPVIWSLILCMCVSSFPQTELSVVPSFSGGMSRGAVENSI